jgi:hypothetical protein
MRYDEEFGVGDAVDGMTTTVLTSEALKTILPEFFDKVY